MTRSDAFLPFLALISTLETVDFNLFIKEDDISKKEFSFDWKNALKGPSINFELFDPSISKYYPWHFYWIFSADTNLAAPTELVVLDEGLLQRLHQLNEENTRLRKSLITQINQRAYFQHEYTKTQARCARMLEENYQLQDENTNLKGRLKKLSQLVDVHEQTNQSLQMQLSRAYEDQRSAVSEKDQLDLLRQTIIKLEADLQQSRKTQKELMSKLEIALREKSLAESRANLQIDCTQSTIRNIEDSWADRVKVLQEQLKLANNLKEEYKRRLKDSTTMK